MHKKTALVLIGVPALAILTAGVAYAASINVTTATAGAAQATVSSCATGAITTTYPTPTDSGSGFQVGSVTVNLVVPADVTACSGKKVYVNLTDGSAVVASGLAAGVPLTTATTTVPLAWVPGKSMADVQKTDIAIQ